MEKCLDLYGRFGCFPIVSCSFAELRDRSDASSVLFVFTLLPTAWYVSKHRDGGGHSIPHAVHGDVEMAPRAEPIATPTAGYDRAPPVPPAHTGTA